MLWYCFNFSAKVPIFVFDLKSRDTSCRVFSAPIALSTELTRVFCVSSSILIDSLERQPVLDSVVSKKAEANHPAPPLTPRHRPLNGALTASVTKLPPRKGTHLPVVRLYVIPLAAQAASIWACCSNRCWFRACAWSCCWRAYSCASASWLCCDSASVSLVPVLMKPMAAADPTIPMVTLYTSTPDTQLASCPPSPRRASNPSNE